MIKKSFHLKKPRSDWWDVWIAGALAQILYNVFSMQWYHYYIYFYIVGLILLVDSLIGWGKLNADGISIRLGLGFKSLLYFEWGDILEAKIVNIKKTSIFTSGGLSKIPFIAGVYVRALVLTFNNGLNQELKSKIKTIKRRTIFKEKVALDDEENRLIIFEKPEGGFKKIIDAIKSFENIEIRTDIEGKKDSVTLPINRKFIYLMDLLVIIITFGTIFYYWT